MQRVKEKNSKGKVFPHCVAAWEQHVKFTPQNHVVITQTFCLHANSMKWFKEEKLGLTYQLCWVSSHCLHLKSLFPLQKRRLQPMASPGCDHGDLPQVCGMSLPRMGCGELSAPYPITDSRATSAGATSCPKSTWWLSQEYLFSNPPE